MLLHYIGLNGRACRRPHHTEERLEAYIFVAFLAYCVQVTLKAKRLLKLSAPG